MDSLRCIAGQTGHNQGLYFNLLRFHDVPPIQAYRALFSNVLYVGIRSHAALHYILGRQNRIEIAIVYRHRRWNPGFPGDWD